jgi:hypothetical protein
MGSAKVNFYQQPELVGERVTGEMHGTPVTTSGDVRAINSRLALERARNAGFRVHKAIFRCPWPCTQKTYEATRYGATARWVMDQQKRGWELVSRVHVDSANRRPAHGYRGDFASGLLLDQVEIPLRAVFKQTNPKPMRIEVPVA